MQRPNGIVSMCATTNMKKYKRLTKGVSYINRWHFGSCGYMKQRVLQTYQHMHELIVISKRTRPSSRDAIMEESHMNGEMRL